MERPLLSFCIVDDDLSFGRSLKRMLNAMGIAAEYFGSAQSFLDSVPSDHFGYAVVDLHMPGCDGLGLLKKMQEFRYAMPVIVVTGHANNTQARELALRSGAVGYLQKPFCGEALMELVHKREMKGSFA